MKPRTSFETWYGRDEPPPEIVKLKAGALGLEFEQGDLRYIRYGDQEVIRRVYVAVRDLNWNTIPATVTNLTLDPADDHFRMQYDAVHQAGALTFRWRAAIEGQSDGTIGYTMRGAAESDFRYNRIGFCVLHPVAGIAGSPFRAVTPGGAISGVLPDLIAPQRIRNRFEAPIFPSCSSLTIDMPGGLAVNTDFEGDLFEMEDQRNWTDGSFKTYCTPLALGYPHQARSGQIFYQKVIVRVEPTKNYAGVAPSRDQDAIRFTLSEESGPRLPRLGFGLPGNSQEPDEREIALLPTLRPDHLKAELHFRHPSWVADLDRAIKTATQLGSTLELAIFLADGRDEPLEMLKLRLRDVPVARVIVFNETEARKGTTSAPWMQLARKHLSDVLPGARFVGGTNGNFAELNRQPPDIAVMDGVSYTINPQVHARDERSLIEGIEAQRDTVVAARHFCGALPICISSVTLRPPFNAAAREDESPPDPNQLPASVDQRQMSLFAAAWTVGSIRSLAMGEADSITYYETTGWRGLMETPEGSPLPHKFPSSAGMVFPVYWVFAFLSDAKQARLIEATWDSPLLLEGLVVKKDSGLGALIANLQPRARQVRLCSLPGGKAHVRRLNEHSMAVAAFDPDAYVRQTESLNIQAGEALLTLDPYETAFLQFQYP